MAKAQPKLGNGKHPPQGNQHLTRILIQIYGGDGNHTVCVCVWCCKTEVRMKYPFCVRTCINFYVS